jgi:hypothetical protein
MAVDDFSRVSTPGARNSSLVLGTSNTAVSTKVWILFSVPLIT